MEERGVAHSRTMAQRLIMAGEVRVNGQVVLKPGTKLHDDVRIELSQPPRFVSRGGEKMLAALQAFNLTNLEGKVCVDIGASTGGFTDCLLQHGAVRVFSVDVGYGVLDWKIRNDPRVVVMEKQNARYLNSFSEAIQMVVIDASFISLRTLLPVVRTWLTGNHCDVIPLIKPQFEAGRAETARGSGVIRDAAVHTTVLQQVLAFAVQEGYSVAGLIKSPLTGPKGNIEFLAHLVYPGGDQLNMEEMIQALNLVTTSRHAETEPGGKLK